jgi:hypothetical protein
MRSISQQDHDRLHQLNQELSLSNLFMSFGITATLVLSFVYKILDIAGFRFDARSCLALDSLRNLLTRCQ